MAPLKRVAPYLYLLVMLPIAAWFAGAITRGEQSWWAVREVRIEYLRSGSGGAALVLFLYAVFYASLYITPYILVSIPFVNAPEEKRKTSRPLRRVTALWVGISFLLFARPFYAFIRAYPGGAMLEWVAILWLAFSLLLCLGWILLIRRPS